MWSVRIGELSVAGRSLLSVPLALVLASSISACSGSQPPSPEVAAAPASAELSGAEEALALSPVPAPADLVGIATLRAPERVLETALGWTRLGLDFRALLSGGPAAALLPVLDLQAPIDVVVTLDPTQKSRPRALFAAAVGLTSQRAALDVFQNLDIASEFVEPGVHVVRPSPKTQCFVAAALGKAKARLVCAQDRESLDALAPYLTRGNPSEGGGDADLHVELRAEAPMRLYGDKTQFLKLGVPMLLGEASIGNAEFDAALRDAANAVTDEIIYGLSDLKELRLDAWFQDSEQELELQLSSHFKGTTSWLARTLRDAAGRGTVAPEAYWRLPLEATEAVYYSPSNPEALGAALPALTRLFQSGLSHLGASPALAKQWPQAFREVVEVPGPVVSARGNVPPAPAADAPARLRAALGYTLVGAEDPEGRYGAFFEQTLRLYEDAALRKGLAQKYGVDIAKLPKVQSRKGPSKLPASRLYEAAVPASVFADELDRAGAEAVSDQTIPIVLLLSREGTTTWLGFSSYADVLENRLSQLLAAPQPSAETALTGKPGLEQLRRDRSLMGGFWTLAGLQSGAFASQAALGELLAPLAGNQTPIVGRTHARAEGPSGTLELHVPSRLFAEVAAAVLQQKAAQVRAPATQP